MHALFTIHWYGCRGFKEKFGSSVLLSYEKMTVGVKNITLTMIMPGSRLFFISGRNKNVFFVIILDLLSVSY